MKNYYTVLKVKQTATPRELKKAYYRLARQHHPDKGGDETIFKELAVAYDVLSDADKRAVYHDYLQQSESYRQKIPFDNYYAQHTSMPMTTVTKKERYPQLPDTVLSAVNQWNRCLRIPQCCIRKQKFFVLVS